MGLPSESHPHVSPLDQRSVSIEPIELTFSGFIEMMFFRYNLTTFGTFNYFYTNAESLADMKMKGADVAEWFTAAEGVRLEHACTQCIEISCNLMGFPARVRTPSSAIL